MIARAADPRPVPIDLTSQSFKADPFPTFAKLRALGPLVRVRLPLFGSTWVATTHAAVNELLRDHQRFAQNPAAAGNRWMGALVRWMPGTLRPLATNMLLRDPPDHRRLRGLVDQAFQKQSVEALRPRLATLADEALDHLEAEAARSRRAGNPGVDLLAHFARPFPLAVICEILGLPPQDRPSFTRWASRFTAASTTPAIIRGLITGLRQMMIYTRDEIRRQTKHPRGGLIASLIEAEEAGDRLSEDELVAMVFLLLSAGHETTLHQITCSVLTLLDHPQHLRELKADWGMADSAAQELLRYVSFAQFSKPRYARADTEFAGQAIRRGEMLFACLAAANADPAAFDEPERLDLRRHPNRHVAFGAGIHYCLGARLAGVEVAVALQRLFTRFPSLQLAAPRSQVRYSGRFGTRALMALRVKW